MATRKFREMSTSMIKVAYVPTAWKRCLRREADVCLINVGGNDITTRSEPEDIYQQIVKLVDQIFSRRRVKLVYIGEVQTRGEFRDGLIKREFDSHREVINHLLRERYGRLFVDFKDVVFQTDYDTDLVHMDMSERLRRNSGMRKYRNRIRRMFYSYRHHMWNK